MPTREVSVSTPTLPTNTRYLLLMRHVAGYKAFHSGEGDEARSKEYPALLSTGVRAARAVALRLRETLNELPPESSMKVCRVIHGPASEPTATAKIVSRQTGLGPLESWPSLHPSNFHPGGGPGTAEELDKTRKDLERRAKDGALVIIGHEPQMGWLADCMTGRPVPIDRGELICLAKNPGDRWRLMWAIHPDDRSAASDIRDKIKSKMDAAKVMGAFITALVTFVITQFLGTTQNPSGVHISTATLILRAATVALLFAAASLFFISLFHYDTLLMPSRFWGSSAPRTQGRWPWPQRRFSRDWLARRPPSSDTLILYQNMTRIWSRTFVPAIWLVGAALITFCQAIVRPDRIVDWWILFAGAVGAMLVVGWTKASRPRLGVHD